MLLYRVTEQNDLDALRSYLAPAWLRWLAELPDQVCIDWADGRGPFADHSLKGKLGYLLPQRLAV